MSYFRCKLHGQNFSQQPNGHAVDVNFYAVRWVEALTDDHAVERAIEIVTRQIEENGIRRPKNSEATLEVEDVEEVDAEAYKPNSDSFIFY